MTTHQATPPPLPAGCLRAQKSRQRAAKQRKAPPPKFRTRAEHDAYYRDKALGNGPTSKEVDGVRDGAAQLAAKARRKEERERQAFEAPAADLSIEVPQVVIPVIFALASFIGACIKLFWMLVYIFAFLFAWILLGILVGLMSA